MDERAGWFDRYRVNPRMRLLLRLFGKLHDRLVSTFCLGLTAIAIASLIGATLVHEWKILRTSRGSEAYPPVLYGLMPSPGTSPVPNAPGVAGGDFVQVYEPGLALRHGESPYFPTTPEFKDRFGRRAAGYPPVTTWLYVPLTYLPYYQAFVVQTVGTLLGFWLVTGLLLWSVGLRKHIAVVLLAQASLYFLTPIGFTHLERGQFDLIVASAIALCVGCVFSLRRTAALAVVSGLLGALKWTSGPVLGCFSVAGVALGGRSRRWSFAIIVPLMVIANVVFWDSLKEYWVCIQTWEIGAKPRGLTFMHFMPRTLSKVLPVILTSIVVAAAWFVSRRSEFHRERMLQALSAPFSVMLVSLALGFGTVSYEYRTVTTLGLFPGLVVWIEKEKWVPGWFKALATGAFGLLLCIGFRTFQYAPPFDSVAMAKTYAMFAGLFFCFSAYVVLGPMRSSRALQA